MGVAQAVVKQVIVDYETNNKMFQQLSEQV